MAPPEAAELWVVVGPTASGKTTLAIELAEQFAGEIISADSIQIYRYFDLGSGKPTDAELARAPHHLVDFVDPLDCFDAARFVALADEAIAEVRNRQKTPIICGGTFLWVKALLFGLAPSPPADAELRRQYEQLVQSQGRAALHARLAAVDPVSAERLEPNDFVRVSRALEVFELSGKPLSQWHAEHQFKTQRHRATLFGLQRERSELDERIFQRTKEWLELGWIDEVRQLLDRGYGAARAMDSVGYRQVRDHIDGKLDKAVLHETIVRATRTFVRRQRTWLRDQPVQWIAPTA